ncbi:MAG: GNAT family N-acetyltransferase, partial [Victivallales bacterium]|nr:GNAT family N-acetyltransferase [Victivallales bacterium]
LIRTIFTMRLVKPSEINEKSFKDFIDEIKSTGEDLVPSSLNQKDMDFQTYITALNNQSIGKYIPDNLVPASTYFLLDDENRICGAVNIRHRLTENLKIEGGHIGYGIRPKARNQNYGTEILKLALEKVIDMGIRKVLVTCCKENVNSARIIQKNSGVLDSEIEKDNKIIQRYWIQL